MSVAAPVEFRRIQTAQFPSLVPLFCEHFKSRRDLEERVTTAVAAAAAAPELSDFPAVLLHPVVAPVPDKGPCLRACFGGRCGPRACLYAHPATPELAQSFREQCRLSCE